MRGVMDLKKLLLGTLIATIISILSACYSQDRLVFAEGFYYQNESIQFTDSVNIDEIKLEFAEITSDEYEDSNRINVLKNHNNSKAYRVIFSLRFDSEEELKNYDFEYIGKAGHSDTYKIIVDFNNDYLAIYGYLTLSLDFRNAISNDLGVDIAGRLSIKVVDNALVDLAQNEIVITSFPGNLEYVQKEENNET